MENTTEFSIYDHEFSVKESEPERAEALNKLKNRVQKVDKKEIISSDENDDNSKYNDEKALSAYLLYTLFPTKAYLLDNFYTKDQADQLLRDAIAQTYLKDQIDNMLNNIKNELKNKIEENGDSAQQIINRIKSELDKHRTLPDLDHPDQSVMGKHLRDNQITKNKLTTDLANYIDGKFDKTGGHINGTTVINADLNVHKLFLFRPDKDVVHYIGGSDNNNLDLGSHVYTNEVALCSKNNPIWYNGNPKRLLHIDDLNNVQNQINNIRNITNELSSKASGLGAFKMIKTVEVRPNGTYENGYTEVDLPEGWSICFIQNSFKNPSGNRINYGKPEIIASPFYNTNDFFVEKNKIRLYANGRDVDGRATKYYATNYNIAVI